VSTADRLTDSFENRVQKKFAQGGPSSCSDPTREEAGDVGCGGRTSFTRDFRRIVFAFKRSFAGGKRRGTDHSGCMEWQLNYNPCIDSQSPHGIA